jgi:hypothetical protein
VKKDLLESMFWSFLAMLLAAAISVGAYFVAVAMQVEFV